VSADACIHDYAIGAGIVRFSAGRREPSVPSRPCRSGVARFERALDDVSVVARSSDCANLNDVEIDVQVVASSLGGALEHGRVELSSPRTQRAHDTHSFPLQLLVRRSRHSPTNRHANQRVVRARARALPPH
jgi:hypothetical protein